MHTRSLRKILAIAAIVAAGCGVDTKSNGKVTITNVTPGTSSITGGVEIQIAGKGFDGGSAPTVVFGANSAEVVNYSGNQMSVVLPGGSGCGNVDIQINNSNGFAIEENAFTYTGGSGVISVTDVTPTIGDIAGGTEITITGTGFTGGAGVLLNGHSMNQIQIVSDTEIRAVTPQQLVGGIADLQVRNCSDEASISGAFLFTSGLNGGYIELPLVQFANPAQYSNNPANYVNPFVAFVEPTTESLLNPIPTLDACVFNAPDPGAGTFVLIDQGAEVSLASGAQSVDLALQSDDSYYYPQDDSTAFQTAKFVFNAPYDLSAAGNATLPPFVAGGAFTTPADFTLSAPNIGTATPTTVPRSQLQFTWNASAPGDFFEIILRGFDNAGAATNQQLECYVADDGSYLIASADVNKLTAASTQFEVFAIRRKDSEFILPSNGSNAVGVGMVYKRGLLYFP